MAVEMLEMSRRDDPWYLVVRNRLSKAVCAVDAVGV